MRVAESPLRDLLRLVVWYPLRLCLERLPPRAGLAVLRALGDLHFAVSRGRKRRLLAALVRLFPAMPEGERLRQAREFFRTHYANQLLIFVFPGLHRGNISELLEFSGLEHLDAVLAQGRGAVLAIGHFGPTQLPLAGLGVLGYDLKQIGNPSDAGLSRIGRHVAFRLRLVYEAKIPAEIVRPGALKRVVAFLRGGGIVMTTADTMPGVPRYGKHAAFPFLGAAIDFPLGPARLALKTGAALLPLFLAPGETAAYRAVVGAPIEPPAGDDAEAAALAMTEAFLSGYAAQAARHPGWLHLLEGLAP